jgi:hypothetical protein
MRLAHDSAIVVTHAPPEETGRKANDNPCRTSFRPDTIVSDSIWFENLYRALADVLAVRVTVELRRSAKPALISKSRLCKS